MKRLIPEKVKENLSKLVEPEFITRILNSRLPEYYDFAEVIDISMEYFKRHIGQTGAVFVTQYQVKYLDKAGERQSMIIFSSAHSDNSRKGAYEKTRLLYENGFNQGKYRVTRPLFYLPAQKAFFYEATPGRSLFHFFAKDPDQDLTDALTLAAGWIRKLHRLNILAEYNWPTFKTTQSISPSPKIFLADFYSRSQELGQQAEQLLKDISEQEKKSTSGLKRTLIYGDYHPENIIIKTLKAHDLVMIDFTDIAIGDPMVDLGIFIQQFDFMGHNYISREKMNQYKTYFLESYFGKKFLEISTESISHINLYQAWTAIRSAIFLFYMKDVQHSVENLLEEARRYLDCSINAEHKINLHG